MKKNSKKQKQFRVEKLIKRKVDTRCAKWKWYDSSFNSWIEKKNAYMSEYVPEPKSSGLSVKVELNMSNYAIKSDLKTATDVDTSKFGKTFGLANLKCNVDKLGIGKLKNIPTELSNLKGKSYNLDADKLVPVPVDLSKLSNLVKKML